MAKKFTQDGHKALRQLVGDGELAGRVTVDQAYAQIQHERLDFKHPRGGGPKYLEGPLYDQHVDYLQNLADHVLDGRLTDAMAGNMEDLAGQVEKRAPVLNNILRRSGHPQVFEHNALLYDRAPHAPREDQSR